jgi:hypothetical protein
MKTLNISRFYLSVLFSAIAFTFTACSPQIELSSSWTNKQAKVKSSPKIMVMVIGKDLTNRQVVENFMVSELQKGGDKAIASLDIFKPDVQKYDSVTMVNMLRANNIDMLLISAVTSITEKERYVPGTTEQVPVGTYSTPYNPYYYNNYNSYYNYYNYQVASYQTIYETRTTPGYTVTDVEVVVESKLFDVATTELLWFGQSKSATQEPSTELFSKFSKQVVDDIRKNNLLLK